MDKGLDQMVGILKGDEAAYANNYFKRSKAVDSLFVKIGSHLKRRSFGNPNAKVIFVLDFEKTDEKALSLIQVYFNKNDMSPYNAYFTQINKTDNEALNKKILEKEIEIIDPHRIVIISEDDLQLSGNVEGIVYLHRPVIDRICNRSELNLEPKDLEQDLNKLNQVMRYAIISEGRGK